MVCSGQKTTHPQWLNHDILPLIKEKRRAWRCYRKSKRAIDYLRYASVRNKVTLAIRKGKRSFESHLVSSFKSNPKHFWKYVNNSSKVRAEIGRLKLPDGSLTSNSCETAEALNNYFASVFTMEDLSQPPYPESIIPDISLSSITITPEQVFLKLSNLNPSKSCGLDLCHPKYFMKQRTDYLNHCTLYLGSLSKMALSLWPGRMPPLNQYTKRETGSHQRSTWFSPRPFLCWSVANCNGGLDWIT